MLHTTSRITLALAMAGATLVGAGAPASSDGTRPTAFALNGSGYGTRVIGGDVPAGSDTTAFQAIGCTNKAGKAHENHVAAAELPGAGTAYETTTDVWTTAAKGVVASNARNTIERIVVGDATTGSLEIRAVSSTSRAFHDGDAFKADTDTVVGALTYTDATGAEQELEVPTPGEPITVPGVATLSIGGAKEKVTDHKALAVSDALVIDMLPTGTKVKVAHAVAEIADDVKHGLFRGRSAAVQTRALQDNVTIGYQPLSLMPCQGTGGELRQKAITRVDAGDAVVLRGLTSRQLADQTNAKASGYGRGRVESVDIGDGAILAENIIGRANVTRTASGNLQRSAEGTKVGTITIDGEEQEFPDNDTIVVPGLAKLERNIVTKLKHGIQVTALRITLLEEDGAVIDLGEARLIIRDAGL